MDDRIAGVVLSLIDISDRKRAQEALQAADARFRAIVNQATVGIVQLDPAGRVSFANGRMGELLGCNEGELVGRDIEGFLHAEDPPRHRELMGRLVLNREPFEIEKRLRRFDGREVWAYTSAAVPADAQSGTILPIAVYVDITERKRTESALRRSEEHLRMVIENAREYAIFTTDVERRNTGWNSGAERILGYAEHEAIGQMADMILTVEDRQADMRAREARQAFVEGRASDDRFHVLRDGSQLWDSGVMMPMHELGGPIVGLVKILRDQTDVRRAQQALAKSQADLLMVVNQNETARAELESANKAKDQFLAVLSHKLRAPLTPAIMTLQFTGEAQEPPCRRALGARPGAAEHPRRVASDRRLALPDPHRPRQSRICPRFGGPARADPRCRRNQ